MCGLAGIISREDIEFSSIRKMTDILSHRGPDAEGFLVSNNRVNNPDGPYEKINCPFAMAFGHRRLAILDLRPEGNQPMCYLSRYWIIYNGEIYNYLELREQLLTLGHRFTTNTDTEVILAAYAEWGNDCLRRFNGMWAMAIYDEKEKRLFFSRDRFGIKPLYYYSDDNIFVFASEIKAILSHPGVSVTVNEEYCKSYYKHGAKEHIRTTAFGNINRFAASSYCEISIEKLFADGITEKRYWQLPASNESSKNTPALTIPEAVSQYYELLSDSVKLCLRSDVDLGITLSGGLDSSSITWLCKQHRNSLGQERLESFSSVYTRAEEKYCDESPFINELSDYLSIKNNRISPDVDEFAAVHKKIIYSMDCPPDSTCISGWYTYKLLKSAGIKVNLEGQGADELLAGYRRYITRYYANRSPGYVFSSIKDAIVMWPLRKNILFGQLMSLIKSICPRRLVPGIAARFGYTDDPYADTAESMREDLSQSLVNLLKYADCEAMHHSVETRFPYLDYRLVEFLAGLPLDFKIRNGWSKYLARLAFDRKLPGKIVWRKDKMGWPVPEQYWLRNVHFGWISEKLRSSAFLKQLFGVDEIESVLANRHETGLLVRLLNLAVWHDVFIATRPAVIPDDI